VHDPPIAVVLDLVEGLMGKGRDARGNVPISASNSHPGLDR